MRFFTHEKKVFPMMDHLFSVHFYMGERKKKVFSYLSQSQPVSQSIQAHGHQTLKQVYCRKSNNFIIEYPLAYSGMKVYLLPISIQFKIFLFRERGYYFLVGISLRRVEVPPVKQPKTISGPTRVILVQQLARSFNTDKQISC